MGLFKSIKEKFNKQKNKEIEEINNVLDNEENGELKKEEQITKKYEEGLEKSRDNFVEKINVLGFTHTKINDEFFDELEDILIMADIGVNTVMDFMDRLKARVKKEKITDFEYLKEVIVDELFLIYVNEGVLSSKLNFSETKPSVFLFVGVNGVGKTTSIAKIASKLKKEGKSVMLIAGDTFRAGAVNQLKEWAERTGSLFYGKDSNDPASVVFDGLNKAKEEDVDVVLIDTAGRLQNKVNLMKELEKINRIIDRVVPGAPHETLLVIDATTGQNGISQAESFNEITNLTGIILTKLDGTAKGGIVLAIKEKVNVPVKFVGFGETADDLMEFDIENYVYGLFKNMM